MTTETIAKTVDDFPESIPNSPEYKNLVNRKKYKRPQLKIEWNQRTRQSYEKQGLTPPNTLDWEVRNFINLADPSKSFTRTVSTIIRIRAQDYDSPKRELKEYLYYYEQWTGSDFIGRTINVGDHLEGSYQEQLLEPAILHGQHIGDKRNGERTRYYIPFSKENVDKIIAKSDGSDKHTIRFGCKTERGRFYYSYDEFVNKDFEDLTDLKPQPSDKQLIDLLIQQLKSK